MTPDLITDKALDPFRHGFFTRCGGVSSGVYASMNCGAGSSDDSDAVAVNRQRAAETMGVESQNLVSVHQVHSADVLSITAPIQGEKPKADAMVTSTPEIALGVLSADCQPVLFADHHAGVIGVAHAGWKGALNGVLEATLRAMEALGADRTNVSAVIGPCISQAAYEVGPEFHDLFLERDSGNRRFFIKGNDVKFQFDLPGYGLERLRRAGVARASWTGHCTYGAPDQFFSFRRGQHMGEIDYGRLLAAIRL